MTDQPIIHFHGAARTVTGSCHLIEYGKRRILVDCGLFQGSKTERELNYRNFPFDPKTIDAVLLTHAHIDHSGLIPKLVKSGFTGSIFATAATTDLCAVMLPDSGHIQETEVEQLNRRNQHRGRGAVTPIYTVDDAFASMRRFKEVSLRDWYRIDDDLRFRLWNAGHLLGSASIEIEAGPAEAPVRLLFSGDIGPDNKLLEPEPEAPQSWDYVITESTYGDTDRQDITDVRRRAALREEVRAAYNDKGALLIPSFAVERTQELIADLVALMDSGEIPKAPIIIDSPLATRATHIFRKYAPILDHGALLAKALSSRQVRFTETIDQSKALDELVGFHIIIAASGMCDAGRIRHRLKNWLWREEATVLLVGYQAAGTLGRLLFDGTPVVRIYGEEINVKARIRNLDLYSGHADGPELAAWMKARQPIRGGVFLLHGEDRAIEGLRGRLAEFLSPDRIIVPSLDGAFRLEKQGAVDISETAPKPRIDPIHAGHTDWHNDYQALVLDIQSELAKAADAKARGVVLRKLRRALAAE